LLLGDVDEAGALTDVLDARHPTSHAVEDEAPAPSDVDEVRVNAVRVRSDEVGTIVLTEIAADHEARKLHNVRSSKTTTKVRVNEARVRSDEVGTIVLTEIATDHEARKLCNVITTKVRVDEARVRSDEVGTIVLTEIATDHEARKLCNVIPSHPTIHATIRMTPKLALLRPKEWTHGHPTNC